MEIKLDLASCSPACVNGECTAPNVCTCSAHSSGPTCAICDSGYTGADCMIPICPDGCIHGTCTAPSTCVCHPRWTGTSCDSCASGWSTPALLCTIGKPVILLSLNQSAHTFLLAACQNGCLNGGCNFPGECYCNTGYSGPTCASDTIASGIATCVYPNVTSTCKVANGQLRDDCPAGYTRMATEACPDIPGYDRNICGKSCCDGWTGPTCTIRLTVLGWDWLRCFQRCFFV